MALRWTCREPPRKAPSWVISPTEQGDSCGDAIVQEPSNSMARMGWRTMDVPNSPEVEATQVSPADEQIEQVWSIQTTNCLQALKRKQRGASPMVQWLRLCLPMQGAWVRSLVRELRSHMLHRRDKEKTEEENPVTCYHTAAAGGHYIKWNKSVTKGWTLYDSTYTWDLDRSNSQKGQWWLPGAEGVGTGGCLMGTDFQFCRMKKFWSFVAQQCEYTWHNRYAQVKTIKIVSFILWGFFYHSLKKKPTIPGYSGRLKWSMVHCQWSVGSHIGLGGPDKAKLQPQLIKKANRFSVFPSLNYETDCFI